VRKLIGRLEFEYEVLVNGERVLVGTFCENLWFEKAPWTSPRLLFRTYEKVLKDWIATKLPKWEWGTIEGEHCGLYYRFSGYEPLKRLEELINLGWLQKPEEARAKLVSALMEKPFWR
jgi:hypothetical protein